MLPPTPPHSKSYPPQPANRKNRQPTPHLRPTFLFYLAFRELRNQKRLGFFFILNLTIGLLSFVLLDSFKESLHSYLDANSRAMMTADVRYYVRRPMQAAEEAFLQKRFGAENIAKNTSYMTMSRHAANSKLVQVNVINAKYPLYGDLLLKDFDGAIFPISAVRNHLASGRYAVIFPELAYFYNIKQGDSITLNDISYEVKYIVEQDAGGSFNFASIAPKVYLMEASFDQSFFSQFGITLRNFRYIKLNENNTSGNPTLKNVITTLRSDVKEFTQQASLSPPQIRIHNESGTATENILRFIARYLSLISLIALFLSGLASTYLFRTFVHQRLKEVAVLQALGMQGRAAFSLSIIELVMISALAAIATTIIGYFLVPYVPVFLAAFLPTGFTMVFSLKSIAITFLVSILGSLVFCLPILISVQKFSLSFLFNSDIVFKTTRDKRFMLALSAIPIFFYIMALWLSGSWRIGSIFTGLFFGFAVLTFFIGWGTLAMLARRASHFPFPLSFIARSFSYYKTATLFYFAAVALSVMLITLVLQIERSIAQEAGLPKGYQVPSLFFFNIVEETQDEFTQKSVELNYPIKNLTPMLAGRLTHINDQAVTNNLGATPNDNHRQEEREQATRRINLTFRQNIYPTETLSAGQPFSAPAQQANRNKANANPAPVEISVEQGYAKELGLSLGDRLTLTLLDIPYSFQGEVINLRRVKWNTFEPNFFIVVQPGVLETFPKSYIATLSLPPKAKTAIQTSFLHAFPNLSILDIEKIITYVLSIVNKLILLVKVLALFALTLGVFLLFSVVNYQVRERRKEITMLKVIGSHFTYIKLMLLGEYVFLGMLSILVGLSTSLLLYYLVTIYIFAGNVYFHPDLLLTIGGSVLGVILLVTYLAASRTLQQKPSLLIKEAH